MEALLTLSYARKVNKPIMHIHNAKTETDRDALLQQTCQLKDFIEANAIEVLNVAGSRESKEPGIYQFTLKLLRRYWQNRAEPIDRLEHPRE